ncbi:DUF1253-domain-containing protein [Microstroma glucosiphilum]|uniref:U3 small nucleolar RNA-associated protein 25 n=1 Tax=Pseudomicrostroma glucosiphilum TaxID=1684307 RepID=A0A316U2J6_9BASI|nr:DUF1253-domain-containing protein [Pseudomicrostroma glucosiphilum]PWN19410.1 DUF1253-domain-containing protein [Pseudomicrostroma glucosiphilum]
MTSSTLAEDGQGDSAATTKLLTLLNVSATKPGKRKRSGPLYVRAPLGGKRKDDGTAPGAPSANNFDQVNDKTRAAMALVAKAEAAQLNGSAPSTSASASTSSLSAPLRTRPAASSSLIATAADSDDEVEGEGNVPTGSGEGRPLALDAFNAHFASEGQGSHAALLSNVKPDALEWEQAVQSASAELGKLVRSKLKGISSDQISAAGSPHANAVASWQQYRGGSRNPPTPLQQELLPLLSSYSDVYHSNLSLAAKVDAREAIVCHAVSHVTKTRRRILKNNEKLAHAAQAAGRGSGTAGAEDVEAPRDQGFTRPKVLILAPMRNTALEWVHLLESLSGCPQVENKSRLSKEYNLPEGAVDKLTLPEASQRYPLDHLDTFRGNIDDNFQLGVKLTRKSLKLFSAFYESDFIVASPLALRLAIEKDRDSDFLSSIEVLVVDQMDVMTMQNWDHLQFVMGHLNKIPRQSHDTDFSRVKQWYLDGQAAHLRQSILLSSYDAPEMRSLYSRQLVNIAGKVRTLQDTSGVLDEIRQGIRSSFLRFDCANPSAEHEVRFQHFTQKTLPNLLKSAVSSSRTLIFIPSYFDFVRLQDHMQAQQLSFVAVSEYSTGKDIARARQQFAAGKRSFLLVTERFHFYRRYVLRGAQTIVWYALPEHANFFGEVMAFPFAKSTSLVEALNEGTSASATASRGAVSTMKKRKVSKGKIGAAAAAAAAGAESDEEEQEEELELDPADVSMTALYSRYDLLRLQRIVGMDLARRMVEEERGSWRFT